MAETLRERLARGYSFSIYIDGTRNFEGTNASYHEEIKQYAGINFTDYHLYNALVKGWITKQEYDETLAYRPIVTP